MDKVQRTDFHKEKVKDCIAGKGECKLTIYTQYINYHKHIFSWQTYYELFSKAFSW